LLGLVMALVIAGLAVALRPSGGVIVGPDRAVVGDEVVFVAAGDVDVNGWRVGDQRTEEVVLELTPIKAGQVTVELETSEGDSSRVVEVVDPPSSLRIEGPGLLPLAATTELTVTGADPATVTWTVDGVTYRQDTLELHTAAPGLVTVVVAADSGDRAERVFTVADGSGG
jgi:hypothetical protein